MKILVVEDEKELRTALKRGLKSNGYTIDEAADGKKALDMVTINDYDLIILDINLPKINGFEVCKKIRKSKNNVPIIMLTARTAIDDKINGLDFGADDYIEKPFSFRELLARIEAVMRRDENRERNIIKADDLKIDTRKKRVWTKNKEIKLTDKEYKVLDFLMRRKGQITTKEDIFEHVWSEEANPFSKTVKVQISNIRKKIDKHRSKGSYIKTIKNRGYLIE
jgi:DNA-binding response OmpR family regulator